MAETTNGVWVVTIFADDYSHIDGVFTDEALAAAHANQVDGDVTHHDITTQVPVPYQTFTATATIYPSGRVESWEREDGVGYDHSGTPPAPAIYRGDTREDSQHRHQVYVHGTDAGLVNAERDRLLADLRVTLNLPDVPTICVCEDYDSWQLMIGDHTQWRLDPATPDAEQLTHEHCRHCGRFLGEGFGPFLMRFTVTFPDKCAQCGGDFGDDDLGRGIYESRTGRGTPIEEGTEIARTMRVHDGCMPEWEAQNLTADGELAER